MLNSLRGRLTLVMIGLAIVPLSVVGGLLTYRNFSTQEQQAEELQAQTALRVAQQVENFITTRPEELSLAVRIRGLTTLGWTGQQRALNELLSYDPYLAELILLDNTGYEITRAATLAPVPAGAEGRDYSGQDVYVVPATTRETYYGPVYFNEKTGEPFMTVSMPVIDPRSDELNTVLIAHLRFKVVWDLIAAQQFSAGQDIYVVSAGSELPAGQVGQGQEFVVAHRDPSVVLRGTAFNTQGIGTTGKGLNGQNVVLGIQRFQVGQQEFAVVSELTTQEAYKPAFQTLYLLLGGLVVLVGVIISGSFFSLRQVTAPLATLANAAEKVGAGVLSVQVNVGGKTEIGVLSRAFNLMTTQLRDLVGTLEARVQARTKDLQLAAQVSEQIATILDRDQLLSHVVELTKAQFGLYHAQIYLMEAAGSRLALAAGVGEPGRLMKQSGHRISSRAERSVVARAARDRRSVVVEDVTEDPSFLPNPMLPETRSEAALPLIVADRVLGVLDVQSEQINRFDADMLAVLSTLAGQIAVAVQNTGLFEQIQNSQQLLQTIIDTTPDWIFTKDRDYRYILVNQAFAEFYGQRTPDEMVGKDDYDLGTPAELIEGNPEKGIVGFRTDDRAVVEGGEGIHNPYDVVNYADGTLHIFDTNKLPLRDAGGNIVGVLGVSHDVTERLRAEEEVRKRASEMQIVAEVGAEVTSLLDPEQLLWNVANLTKEQFGLYHAHIYLLDDTRKDLVLSAGAGEVGQRMVEKGFSISVTNQRSVVARAARARQAVIMNDVAQASDFLLNPLLPATKAEMAVPMIVGNRVVGVLDVQADRVGYFTEEDTRVMAILASQIAVAVQNARQFEAAHTAQHLLQTIIDTMPDWIFTKDRDYRYILVNQAFAEFYGQRTPDEMVGKDDYDLGTPAELIEGNPEKDIVGFRTDDRAVVEGGETIHNPYDVVNYADGTLHIFDTNKLPLRDAGGNIVGVLGVSHDVTERLRAEEEVRKRASEMQIVAEVGAEVTSLLDAEQLLWNVANLTKERFDLYHAHIYLLDDAGTDLLLTAGAGDSGQAMVSMGHRISLSNERSVVARTARARQVVIVNSVMRAPDFLPNPLLPATKSEMAIPLVVGDRVLGVLDVQSDQVDRFTEEDARVMTILASQIAVAVQNARQFEATQSSQRESRKRASEMQIVAEVGAEVTSLLDPEQLLWDVANLTKERFDLYHAHFYLLDDAGKSLALKAGAGEVGQTMIATGLAIPVTNPRSLVARAARERETVIVNNVMLSPDFLPNPLLPATKSEMAIPLVVGDQALGVLDVQSDQVDRFTEEDARVMTILASQIAVAVQTARQFEATQSSQQLLRLLIDNLPDHIYVKDRQGRFTIRNKAGARHMGAATTEEVIGKTDFDYYLPELAESYYADEQRIIQSGQPLIDHEEPIVDAEGNRGWILTTKMPLRDRQGQIIGLVGIGHDITQIKRTEQELVEREQLLRTLIDNLPDLVYAKDTEGRKLLSNRADMHFMGVEDPDDVIGKTDFDFYPYEQAAQFHADDMQVIQSGEPVINREESFSVDGESHWLLTTKVPLRDSQGRAIGLVGIGHDITERIQADHERVEREQLLRSIIDTTPAWIFAKDRDHRFMLANKMFAYEYTGLEPDEVVGKDDYDLGKPADLVEGDPEKRIIGYWPTERSVTEEGQTIHLDYDPVTFRDGSPRVLDTTRVPLRDAEGNIIGVLGVSLDITERLRAEETIRRYASEMETVARVGTEAATSLETDKLLQSVSDLTKEQFGLYHAHIYLTDSEGESLMLAAGAGLAGQRMVAAGHRIALANERSLVARAARIRRSVVINNVTQVSDFLPNPLLPATKAEMAVPMIVGKRVIGVLDVQADEVDRFAAEDMRIMTILASQIAVAIQNAQLYSEQVEVADRLRDVDRLKSEFLASMSHELRTPLNSIIGYAEVLLDGIDGDLTDDMQEDITAIHGSGKHLLNLINDILDLAKIEAGQMDLVPETLDLGPLAEDMVNASRVLLKDKPVELVLDLPDDLPLLRADGLRLRQIINNLLTNAIKFTEEGRITVLARAYEADPCKVVISVSDTGIGIKEEHLPMIFDRFRQVDQSHTRRASGTGLGLSITRQLVQLHGGEIWAESESGVGSTFYFTIPGAVEESVTA